MVMNAFLAVRFNTIPGYLFHVVEFHSDFTDDILNEFWIVVCLFGDIFFIRSFQDRIKASAGRRFNNFYQILYPYDTGIPDLYRYSATLVMSAEFRNLLGTGTQCVDRNGNSENKIFLFL